MTRDLIERLRAAERDMVQIMIGPCEERVPDLLGLAADRIAALEAEASEGERRGLERAAEVAESRTPTHSARQTTAYAGGNDRMGEIHHARHVEAWEIGQAIRALIPEAPAREGWQPIETAPKARAILVYDTGQGRCIAYWTQWHDNLLSEDREGWRTMGDWERLDWVTHWMAIPGPPPPRDQREG